MENILHTIVIILAYGVLLFRTAKKALKQLKNKVLDENTLITISTIGAYLVGEEMEGAMVIFLYEIGKILEAKAVNKSRKSIADLMNIKPEFANIKTADGYKTISPEEVKIGDILIVKTGEKIALDGIVIEGEAQIDNSALTGESKLIDVQKGTKVLSGSINIQGLLQIEVTNDYQNSTVSKILELVENATDKKAKTETFVAKAARIYTPSVLGLAILVAIFMPMFFDVTYSESIYKALTFLVISCPCSIAISVPLSYFSGIGKASKNGILIKGSDYLDGLKDIRHIVFDKTGTITVGNLEVEEINSTNEKYNKEQVLNYFALGESFSNHPIAKSILKKVDGELDLAGVTNFEEVMGKGICYEYENSKIKIGNARFVELNETNDITATVLYLKLNDEVIGNVVLKDKIKEDAAQVIKELSKMNIKTSMFTGDKKEVAYQIGKEAGIEHIEYEMLPTDKYNRIEELMAAVKDNSKISFVGDGINDSPVLARADIGISMGGIGSSSAIESSDIVIMTDELKKISQGIGVSRKTNRIIKQNLVFAIGTKLAILILSILGIANMWEAVFADVGVTVIAILNTLRILR